MSVKLKPQDMYSLVPGGTYLLRVEPGLLTPEEASEMIRSMRTELSVEIRVIEAKAGDIEVLRAANDKG